MTVRVTRRALTLPTLPSGVRSVDVCFDEQRVWSIDLATARGGWRAMLGGRTVPWPTALRPHLSGRTTVILRDSANGRELARSAATFSDDAGSTRVVDDAGAPLAVNKWGRLGHTLDDDGVQDRILAHTSELILQLAGLGLRPFIVGGTLLGAVRDQALLPHDDDADVAYLSEHTDPVEVAREGLRVGRALQALGHEVVRHSATHMQLYFRDGSGAVDHYVDVFAAFFTDDGCINQPFHVRGPMRHDQMLPFGTVSIAGTVFPAPADTERWLTINYDENWRTPIPGFRLLTPLDTRRRFENWFGLFNSGRDFWNSYHSEHSDDTEWRTGAEWILDHEMSLRSDWCIDIGGGTGVLGSALSEAGKRKVVVADYAPVALDAARRRSNDRLSVVEVNLLQLDAIALPSRAGVTGAFDLVANHVLDQADGAAMPQALRLARMALRSGGTAVATLYARRDPDRPDSEPSNGFCRVEALRRAAEQLRLGVEITPLRAAPHEQRRAPYGVRFHIETTDRTDRSSEERA